MTTTDGPTALIVGAGIMGTSTALALARRGWRVTLLEQATVGHDGASSGGESRLLRSSHGTERWYTDLAWSARDAWQRLEAETDTELLVETGLIWFARDHDGWEADSLRVCAQAGVPIERWSPRQVAALYPSVRTDDLAFGAWEPHAGVLRARRAVQVLAAHAVRCGARLHEHTRAVPRGVGVRVDGAVRHADRVIWACGPWLPSLLARRRSTVSDDGSDAAAQPGHAEVVVTQQDTCFFSVPPDWHADRVPAWVDFAGAAYGAGALDGHGFKCSSDAAGPVFDPDRDDRLPLPVHVDAARRMLSHRFPALADAPVSATRTCQYTTTADTGFVISPLDDERVWVLGGGSGHAFKHGPALGAFVADVLEGERPLPRRFGLDERVAGASLRTAGHTAPGGRVRPTSWGPRHGR